MKDSVSFLVQVQKKFPGFAKSLERIAEQDFYFKGSRPLEHSTYNHNHLWMLCIKDSQIDFHFRKKAIQYLFSRWKTRLKAYQPYKNKGYRLYLYEDSAPTISVVAETPEGFPYKSSGNEAIFVDSIDKVLEVYDNLNFDDTLDSFKIIKAVEKFKGSIGIPTAQFLGVNVGELRKVIENHALNQEVNLIRKKYRRAPAKFKDRDAWMPNFRIYEEILPPGYI